MSFAYADSKECVLEHVSFVAEAGKTTAIVGSTGSGKSTVVKLVERFYDVTAGSVTLDGVDVRDLTQRELRSQLGYVPQKAFLFSGTIASNVAYADEGMPRSRVEEAADIAQATEFVSAKEEGFDAPVSQGGTNVSGGQRQRLAIARALATDARAYLFDDSFSALDYKTDASCGRSCESGFPARRWSSWRSASLPCCTPTASWCWTKGAWPAWARTTSSWKRARSTGRSRSRSFRKRN